MNEGVKILIERMESNPEDFLWEGKFHKQAVQMRRAFHPDGTASDEPDLWYLDADDLEQLRVAYCKYLQNQFTATVMKKLFEEPQDETKSGVWISSLAGARLNAVSGWKDPRLVNAVQQNIAQQSQALQNATLQNRYHQLQGVTYQNEPEWDKDATYLGQSSSSLFGSFAKKLGFK